ncbi:CocE/NonD family hydrolase [Gordonia sp. TBRC 11910]|uniref:CocE/NonD family hydrolase n=1 Tax=Gordonia asplenii TaxID=2725283 RepID=A0A848L247_9ACTN|nr:CocE/NonD family hydrolase [Gordonia asplenii]NMO04502.1 CocE/NonD family hydrolase [Gordonia asplenii]
MSFFALPADIVVERDVEIQMDDGVTLRANVYRPDGDGEYPVILSGTAYGKDEFTADYCVDFPALAEMGCYVGSFQVSDHTSFEAPDPAYWVPRGYVVAVYDTRGYFRSDGRPGLFSPRDIRDYAAVVEWAGTRSWSNGRVATMGVSQLAILQWYLAAQRPAHLTAIVPWEGASDPFADINVHGGIPETRFNQWWLQVARNGTTSNSLTLNPLTPHIGKHLPQLARHIVQPAELEQIEVPALICAAWSRQGLHSRGAFRGFERIGSRQKWLYTHGRKEWQVFYEPEALAFQERFLEHFLKGHDNGMDEVPPVRLEIRHSLRQYAVRAESSWPPPDITPTKLYLDADDGTMGTTRPQSVAAARYEPDASPGLTFTTTFQHSTEITGPTALRLWVQTDDAADMDLFVVLRKLDASGEEVYFEGTDGFEQAPVAHGWQRASRRLLKPGTSTSLAPDLDLAHRLPMEKRHPTAVEIEILPHSTYFRAGEQLVLQIAGHDIGGNPRMGCDRTINKGPHILHTGGPWNTHLLVPLVSQQRSELS